jgi:hypothetical protein
MIGVVAFAERPLPLDGDGAPIAYSGGSVDVFVFKGGRGSSEEKGLVRKAEGFKDCAG